MSINQFYFFVKIDESLIWLAHNELPPYFQVYELHLSKNSALTYYPPHPLSMFMPNRTLYTSSSSRSLDYTDNPAC